MNNQTAGEFRPDAGADTDEIIELPESATPPQNINTTRRIGDRLYVAGEGKKPSKIMFIATALLEEEAQETQFSVYERKIKQKPRYLKGAPGAIFKASATI